MWNRDGERAFRVDGALARAGIFQGIAPAAIAAVVSRLEPVEFPRGHQVFSEGDVGDRLYIIVAGKVKVGRRTFDGRESLLALMGPADMFGELALFDPGPRTSTVTALTDVQAMTMDRAALRMWIHQYPEIAAQLLQVLARRLRRTNDTMTAMIFTDVPGRVAKQLIGLAQRYGVRDGAAVRVDHELTQEELAQLVGAARETVNKALGDFVQCGWIRLQGKTVFIDDPQRLARRAR